MSLVMVTPSSETPFQNDWTDFLAGSGQSISSRVWTIEPDEGGMIGNPNDAIVWVKGFLRGKDYLLKETITGNGMPAVKETRSFLCRCETNL